MKIESLNANDVGLPTFPIQREDLTSACEVDVSSFDLSSHSRARQAIAFGLQMRSQGQQGSHVFVVGGDRSGRMTATLEYLKSHIKQFPPPPDWVYLNNFSSPNRPSPYRLPAGMGYQFKQSMEDLITSIREVFHKTFNSPAFMAEVAEWSSTLQEEIDEKIKKVQEFAHSKGLHIQEENDQFTIVTLEEDETAKKKKKTGTSYTMQDVQEIRQNLGVITSEAHLRSLDLGRHVMEKRRQEGDLMIRPLMKKCIEKFSPFIQDWIDDLHNDILEHVEIFLLSGDDEKHDPDFFNRYAVNVLVDNRHTRHPSVILEPSPTYENLFGSIKYKALPGGFSTDFTLIRCGSLHRANGGILVIRSEAIAANMEVWNALKAAMRDRLIRIEERHRENAMPMLDAPEPKGIPLDVQIFIIGAPIWYYTFFYNDPDFKTYFKIKADIEPSLDATPKNISIYTRLIRNFSCKNEKKEIDPKGIEYLIGYSARWTGHRQKLSAKFEIIADVLSEASVLSAEEKSDVIHCQHVKNALKNKRSRNATMEDRTYQDIASGLIMIDTKGSVVGQVNGLTVLTAGDHQYGLPCRITARTYAGEEGILNIEKLTEMSGPIQQKGAFILDGYLNGLFSHKHPVSCSCSLTFEQSYEEIEGDSASLAELIAILSSLSEIPVRQDLSVTGSLNQFGCVQAIGGVHHKIEGFFRTCLQNGLTGTQGVIIPKTNKQNVILRDDVTEAVRSKKFFVYAVSSVEEAVLLMMGTPAGTADKKGSFQKGTVFEAVSQKLNLYQRVLNRKGR